MRVDKYIFTVRIFKSRSIATDYCDKGKVQVNEQVVKASRPVKPDDVISISREGITRVFKIKQLAENRLPAKLVPEYMEEITPAEEIEKLKKRLAIKRIYRPKGTGRPTKKERRDLDDFTSWWEG